MAAVSTCSMVIMVVLICVLVGATITSITLVVIFAAPTAITSKTTTMTTAMIGANITTATTTNVTAMIGTNMTTATTTNATVTMGTNITNTTKTTTTRTTTTTSNTSTYNTNSTTISITNTTTPSCSIPSSVGRIFNFTTNSEPPVYALHIHYFNATSNMTTLTFVMQGDSGGGNRYWLLDDVSVNDTYSGGNVLTNGDFEMGTLTGWTQYCATNTNCGGSGNLYGQITTNSCNTGTYCYQDKCSTAGNFDYLVQSFPTIGGDEYLLSFYLRTYINGSNWFAYVNLT